MDVITILVWISGPILVFGVFAPLLKYLRNKNIHIVPPIFLSVFISSTITALAYPNDPLITIIGMVSVFSLILLVMSMFIFYGSAEKHPDRIQERLNKLSVSGDSDN